jgi:hypothetical protein
MAENNNDSAQAFVMSGRFTAHHNPAIVGLRASNLNLMLIGYMKGILIIEKTSIGVLAVGFAGAMVFAS